MENLQKLLESIKDAETRDKLILAYNLGKEDGLKQAIETLEKIN